MQHQINAFFISPTFGYFSKEFPLIRLGISFGISISKNLQIFEIVSCGFEIKDS